ncbi:lactadherin-like [Dendronephthya gigantea]|uniref:lactadherin-like n=1 Tax=Dendronephthya gigantea TaxID=151771 RepID=UPI00106CA500|nr:lactadherin-like [Dendronephthya gigantea]
MDIFCELQCAEHRFCVAYNYKKKADEKKFNCQLTNTTEHKFDEHEVGKEEQVWTFYKINVDRSQFATCRGEMNECHNGGIMIWDPEKEYLCQCLDCYEGSRCENVLAKPLGMANGIISNNQINVSSEWKGQVHPNRGRLNMTGAWSSDEKDLNQWFQVDFQRSTLVTGISTQGRTNLNQFVKSYIVSFSQAGDNFQIYTQEGKIKRFKGNNDRNSIVHHIVIPHISARLIRIHPTAWYGHISMRVEFYGCS